MSFFSSGVADIYRSLAGKALVEAHYTKLLKRWPIPHRFVLLPTCHGETFVIISGDTQATPLVLFHGAGGNSSTWLGDVAGWTQQHCVYAVDLIGEPGRSAPSRPSLASDAYAAWLDDVWGGLGLSSAGVLGVSLGAWVALDYALRRPARVAALCLISPSGIGRLNYLGCAKVASLAMLGNWGRRRSISLAHGDTNRAALDTDPLFLISRHVRPRLLRIPLRSDSELAALTMPIHVVLGAKDIMVRSDETRERLAKLVPHAKIVYLDDAAHIVPRRAGRIAEFLKVVTIELA